MAWPENLTPAQQTFITSYIDQVFRPAILSFVKGVSAASDQIIPGALASPSSLTSTMASPASDSVLGLLGALTGTDVIPLSTVTPSGFPLIQPLNVAQAISFIQAMNTVVQTYWQLPNQEAYSLIVGAPNV